MDSIKQVCCLCQKVIRDGATIDGMVSHGLCERCAKMTLDADLFKRMERVIRSVAVGGFIEAQEILCEIERRRKE